MPSEGSTHSGSPSSAGALPALSSPRHPSWRASRPALGVAGAVPGSRVQDVHLVLALSLLASRKTDGGRLCFSVFSSGSSVPKG